MERSFYFVIKTEEKEVRLRVEFFMVRKWNVSLYSSSKKHLDFACEKESYYVEEILHYHRLSLLSWIQTL